MAKTTIPMVRIHDLTTGEIIDREMNDQELAEHEQILLEQKEAELLAKQKAEQRQAILDRLGLTADEAKLLLG
jgi:hypothetical protein